MVFKGWFRLTATDHESEIMSRKSDVPALREHKPSGLAVVRLNGKDHYLGRHGSPESQQKYHILIGKWLEGGRNLAEPDLTVASLCAKYWRFAQDYYRKPDRTPTGHQNTIRLALRHLNKTHGPLIARVRNHELPRTAR